MVFIKKKASNNTFSIEDLSYLNKLLKTNMPITNALNLIRSKKNSTVIDQLISSLDSGLLIENSISSFLPKAISSFLSPLLKALPFSIALDISLSFYERVKENEKQIISSIGYPCVLLFVSLTALYLFDLYGIDSIFAMLKSFKTDLGFFTYLRNILRMFMNVFYYGILLVTIVILIYSRPNKIAFLYLMLSKYFPNSLVHVCYCEQFVSLLLICCKRGYKTKQSLEMLKNMKTKPVISFLAYHLDDSLLKGESLKDASKQIYYDNSLSRFIKIASYSNDFVNILEGYVTLAKEKIEKKIKRYTMVVQMCTYSFIGIVIIFIYQILFLPMQALSNL